MCNVMRLLTGSVLGRLILVVGAPVWVPLLCLVVLLAFLLAFFFGLVEYIVLGPMNEKQKWESSRLL